MATVVLLGTLDTKGIEYDFLRDRLREAGVEVTFHHLAGSLPARNPRLPGAPTTARRRTRRPTHASLHYRHGYHDDLRRNAPHDPPLLFLALSEKQEVSDRIA